MGVALGMSKETRPGVACLKRVEKTTFGQTSVGKDSILSLVVMILLFRRVLAIVLILVRPMVRQELNF